MKKVKNRRRVTDDSADSTVKLSDWTGNRGVCVCVCVCVCV